MTWTRDGSGLDVKRVRGMTLPQCNASKASRFGAASAGESKRSSRGRLSEVCVSQRDRRDRRKTHRDRRTKRLAKAATRRAERFMARLRPLIVKMTEASSRATSARWTAAMQLNGTYASSHTYNITVRDPAAPFDQARQEADEAIARAIMGDPLGGRSVTVQPLQAHLDCASADARIEHAGPGLCAFCGNPLDAGEVDHALGS